MKKAQPAKAPSQPFKGKKARKRNPDDIPERTPQGHPPANIQIISTDKKHGDD